MAKNNAIAVCNNTTDTPNFFEAIINPNMMAKNVNASLREAIVGVIIANTASIRRVNVSEYEQLLNEAKRFANASRIFVLKDDKRYKEFGFGYNDDMKTMKALQELLNFFTSTEGYYEDKYGTILEGESYLGFCYKSNIGHICVVCYNDNNDTVEDF